jgi:hypothetical protein
MCGQKDLMLIAKEVSLYDGLKDKIMAASTGHLANRVKQTIQPVTLIVAV